MGKIGKCPEALGKLVAASESAADREPAAAAAAAVVGRADHTTRFERDVAICHKVLEATPTLGAATTRTARRPVGRTRASSSLRCAAFAPSLFLLSPLSRAGVCPKSDVWQRAIGDRAMHDKIAGELPQKPAAFEAACAAEDAAKATAKEAAKRPAPDLRARAATAAAAKRPRNNAQAGVFTDNPPFGACPGCVAFMAVRSPDRETAFWVLFSATWGGQPRPEPTHQVFLRKLCAKSISLPPKTPG